ncbi:adenine phosphoribosyltransferase [Maribacter sp. MMG018]|uniref:adenine phosphoribosyltransferase n=1 Tax=Maribacter sp. MMG018 TaxID=2822688 RepID=UPI001B3715CE|nr:adenine phosphoribosyltransferase [Maribacter sp. MMG018]MBQ4914326.1 adenine phosphoribosyltransferase [Maribacter sp. MMG018]
MDFKSYIRDVPDFPKKGIVFKDITPLLQDYKALKAASEYLVDGLLETKIDKVVGMESRGFLFGPMLAERLQAGFVPIRKPGKLPYKTLSEAYDLEYGTDTLEIHIDGVERGDKVLIHDDVLATGGTAMAAGKLVEKLGGEIVQFSFLIELSFLKGREKIKSHPINSLITY